MKKTIGIGNQNFEKLRTRENFFERNELSADAGRNLQADSQAVQNL
ncbi:MAG: hypothetical protein HFE75_02355 [Firmicutes bacterium]|jgi:hypothetical protein|nr:hypothetical protein [Bacillota bacterium]